ncbi:HlyD family efflux transporter periplasmic adaptor subunit [Erysipelothrix urinaevulpis]|uniref:HlyD family efflux transporter periplasmic adaptor subunit n=1 Tax=Erysipelothrix urinaevulpis TaxID=2683717 RepID=UPI001358E35B|nr:HlyD family efflux transporter periplasmic adaptor subunit [Erysipelothrix urinaevulpis]
MKLYSKNELRDSRIFFDKEPPKFGTYFSIFIGFLLIASLVASSIIKKTYIVKAQGVVRGSDAQYISSNVNGMVTKVMKSEGSTVKENDVLLVVSDGKESLQEKVIIEQLEQAYEKVNAMDKYQESLTNSVNYMKNSGLEQEYFGYMEYYLQQKESDNFSDNIESKKIKNKEKHLSKVSQEVKDLENDIHRFKSSGYRIKKNEIKKNIKNTQKKINELGEEFTQEQDEDKKTEIEKSLQKYKDLDNKHQNDLEQIETQIIEMSDLEIELENKINEIKGMKEELDSLKDQFENPMNQTSQMKSQLMMELGKNRSQVETKITELESNLKLSLEQKETYQIKATHDGVIHYVNPMRVGSSLQQNQVIADVSTQDIDKFIIEAYILASDISKISLNDDVNIAVNGVNSTKFGTLKGKLVFIDSGTISQESQEGNMLLYRVKINSDSYILKSKDETIEIISSMPVEARIVYEKETYLDWMLNMLNLKN